MTSVAAHTLYEKSDPLSLPGPGGHLDLSQHELRAGGRGPGPSPREPLRTERRLLREARRRREGGLSDRVDRRLPRPLHDRRRSTGPRIGHSARALDNFDLDDEDCGLSFKLYGKRRGHGRPRAIPRPRAARARHRDRGGRADAAGGGHPVRLRPLDDAALQLPGPSCDRRQSRLSLLALRPAGRGGLSLQRLSPHGASRIPASCFPSSTWRCDGMPRRWID